MITLKTKVNEVYQGPEINPSDIAPVKLVGDYSKQLSDGHLP